MLAAVLPGIRHLRTPLACGIVWMAILWLLLARHLPSREQATGLLAQIHELAALAGPGVVLGALAFVAYIIGDIWGNIQTGVRVWTVETHRMLPLPRFGRKNEDWLLDQFTTSDGIYRELLPNFEIRRPNPDDLTEDVRVGLKRALWSDLNRAPIRLLGTDSKLHDQYDRYWSEYVLREWLAFPAAVLIGRH